MTHDRWEWLEGVRPQTPAEWAVSQMAKILLEELSSWPLEIAWSDPTTRRRYAELFAEGAPPPSNSAIEEAIIRARWDLSRDHEALDHYHRNQLLAQACPAAYDQLASQLIETYLTEALFELIERTENRLKRRHAISCLDELAALLPRAKACPSS